MLLGSAVLLLLASTPALAAMPEPGRLDDEKTALWTAIDDVRRSIALYEATLAHGKWRPFPRILRAKRRHARRLVKLALARGHGDPPVLWDRAGVAAPPERTAACARAVDQELRNAAIYETALAQRLSPRVERRLRAIHRVVRNRHIVAFEACVRAG
ncbi:MAG: hypothetical protein K1X88_14780 [Nannocystaceae bacterium]|nr:hypothetical protein [Nannocystaceae bacterium]